jgi:hypothetical protein
MRKGQLLTSLLKGMHLLAGHFLEYLIKDGDYEWIGYRHFDFKIHITADNTIHELLSSKTTFSDLLGAAGRHFL